MEVLNNIIVPRRPAPARQSFPDGIPMRVRRRGFYIEERRFSGPTEFELWWQNEERNWRMNSRHKTVLSVIEYWRCAFKQGRRYTCLGRCRITYAYSNKYVIFALSRDHPHNHAALRADVNAVVHRPIPQPEVYPVQAAQLVTVGPNGAITHPNPSAGTNSPAANAAVLQQPLADQSHMRPLSGRNQNTSDREAPGPAPNNNTGSTNQ